MFGRLYVLLKTRTHATAAHCYASYSNDLLYPLVFSPTCGGDNNLTRCSNEAPSVELGDLLSAAFHRGIPHVSDVSSLTWAYGSHELRKSVR